MTSRKIEKARYGPGMIEIVLGAVLSLCLGIVLALAILVLRPVKVVREVPKDLAPGAVCYLKGGKEPEKSKQWLRKRRLFVEGSSIVLNEDELNAWITAGTSSEPEAPKKPGQSPAAAPAKAAPVAASSVILQPGFTNFRVRDGVFQLGNEAVLNLDILGYKQPLVIQVAGHFEKRGESFVLVPDRFYVGSCPLHRIPGATGLLLDKLLANEKVPEDIDAAWKKLASVSIDGNLLKLSMP